MRALLCRPGNPILTADHPEPVPAPDEALITVLLAGICSTDRELLAGYMGFEGVLGHEFVGRVDSCPDRPELVGHRVVGEINCPCGQCPFCAAGMGNHCPNRSVLGIDGRDGCLAEKLVLPAANLHPVPDGISDVEAVFTEPLAAACRILEQVDPGTRGPALVIGDGKLGILSAWILSGDGECPVTLLGRHRDKLSTARDGAPGELVAIHTDDWAPTDPDQRFPLVVEASGSPSGLAMAASATRPGGILVLKSTLAGAESQNLTPLVVDEIRLVGSRCGPFPTALASMARHRYPLERLVSGRYPLDRGVEALARATRPGCIKVLVDPAP
jgi:threonine dehydrogenase-like Zn-dependent dehydrogenase